DLNQLSIEGVRALAAYSLAGEVAEDLTLFLTQQAEGNPFFTEQLALDLRERGLLRQDSGAWHIDLRELDELPVGVNGVLIARLDRLAAQVRAVVQMAAVLGHEFEVRILSQMLRDDEHLPTKVKQAETMVIWSALSDVRYLFRHALLRDAAYEMQLQERLRELHALAGVAMGNVYAYELPLHP